MSSLRATKTPTLLAVFDWMTPDGTVHTDHFEIPITDRGSVPGAQKAVRKMLGKITDQFHKAKKHG